MLRLTNSDNHEERFTGHTRSTHYDTENQRHQHKNTIDWSAEQQALDRWQKQAWRLTPCGILLILVFWLIHSRLEVKCPENSHSVVVNRLGCQGIAQKYVVSLKDLYGAVGSCVVGQTICVPKTGVVRPYRKVVPGGYDELDAVEMLEEEKARYDHVQWLGKSRSEEATDDDLNSL